jgi:hypothetical protein
MTKPRPGLPRLLPFCRLCGERVTEPCDRWLPLAKIKLEPVPNWPRYDPIELPPNCFADNIEEVPDLGRLPSRPPTLPGTRSSMGWTRES